MIYTSTRGKETAPRSSAYAIKTGLAEDGGLYMPLGIPELLSEDINALAEMSYPERAAKILSLFLEDYTADELLSDAKAAYSEEKFGAHPAPVTKLDDGTYMLELWHGPTSAFKDMALQLMPRLFTRALKKSGENRSAMILVATSGDTGKAALEGYRDIPGTTIKVFYPVDGVSTVQKLQMQTQEGSNVSVSAIRGNFDDAQNGVKAIFSDEEFKAELNKKDVFLSSANSINWGRLVPQIVYYVSAYCDMIKSGAIKCGEKIDVCVPTGNFGNIFAAFIAKLMGLPIEKLICASNMNNVLTDFLRTGEYNKNRAFHTTISPSMDILISSNLERLLFTLLGPEKTSTYMKELRESGKYKLKEDEFSLVKESFLGYFTDEEETKKTIKDCFEKKNCLIDTHTAVALHAANTYATDYKAERKILVVSTASAYKFANDVLESLRGTRAASDILSLSELEKYTGTKAPSNLSGLTEKKVLHSETIDKDEMKNNVLSFANN